MAAGADCNRVYFVGDVRDGERVRTFDPARDMDELARVMTKAGDVRLLIVDPVVNAIAGDGHKNTDVRRGLQPLANLAAKARCVVLGITHFSKGTSGREPLERITGSIAFGAFARIVMVAAKGQPVTEGEPAPRMLVRAKSNLGPDGGGFEYELVQRSAPGRDDLPAAAVQWGGSIDGSARELLATTEISDPPGEASALDDAQAFLADMLADGPLPANKIFADAKGAGHSDATIRRAKTALGVESRKDGEAGIRGGWVWALPRRCSKNAEDAQQKEVSILGSLDRLGGDGDLVEVVV
jgi:putative DNA primase/helicase